jgi:hypothetical protein
VRNLEKHVGVRLFDMVISNYYYEGSCRRGSILCAPSPNLEEEYSVYTTDLVDKEKAWRHDSKNWPR